MIARLSRDAARSHSPYVDNSGIRMKMIHTAPKVLAGVIALALSPMALAATVSINPAAASATPGGGTSPTPLAVTFGGDGVTVGFEVEVAYDTASLDATVAAANGASCANNDATGVITVIRTDPDLNPLPAGPTTFCNVTFTVGAGVADGTALTLDVRNGLFGDAGGNPSAGPHTLNDGVINVAAAATPLTLAYAPAAGSTITFAAGNLGSSAPDQAIAATASGNSGTASLSSCAITGGGAAAFSVTPTSLTFNAAGTQNLTVGCDYQAAAATAVLTCSETDADSTSAARTWNLSCPAGAVVPVNPTVTSNPAAGATIAVGGALVGQQGLGIIDFTAAGGAGSGSTTINCTSTGTVQIALSPTTPGGTTANQTVTGGAAATDVRVGVVLAATPQTPAGTVSCAITPAGGATTTSVFTINAPGGSVFTPPEVIPSASTWSKIAMFSLLGLFGMMAVGFRRQG